MKNITFLILALLGLVIVGCTTVAPIEYVRSVDEAGKLYRVSGQYEPNIGWAGKVTITINDESVIEGKLPVFSNTAEMMGDYLGQPVLVQLTKVKTFNSKYLRADVTMGDQHTVSLTF